MGYGFGFGWVVMLLFWLFVIAAIVWLALTLTRSQTRRPDESDALHILRERFARGEIDIEEFRARRVALEEARR
jgi:putative membrane protein